MRNLISTLFAVFLAFILSPGLLLRLPKHGSPIVVAMVHAIAFGILFYLFHQQVASWSLGGTEGLRTKTKTKTKMREGACGSCPYKPSTEKPEGME